MEHGELIRLAIGAHGSVLVGALVAFYKYGDRTDTTEKSLRGTSNLMDEVRTKIGMSLTERLRVVFERSESTPTVNVGDQVSTYIETSINPSGSEAFREEIAKFLSDDVMAVADFVEIRRSRTNYCFWSRRLSWLILSLVIWQATTCAILSLIDLIGGYALPDWMVQIFLTCPTVLIFSLAMIALIFILKEHDRIEDQRAKHKMF